jgi:hypothetical protein
MPNKDLLIQEPIHRVTRLPLADNFCPIIFDGRYKMFQTVQFNKIDNNMKMSPPIRPWFNKLSKIPDYISLPTFFHLEKQEPHKLDIKREKAIEAERAK